MLNRSLATAYRHGYTDHRPTFLALGQMLLIRWRPAWELESQVLVARDLAYLSIPSVEDLVTRLEGLRRRLTRLIQSMT